MSTADSAPEALDHATCWSYLEAASVGRLAVDVAGQPDIFPINVLAHDGDLYFKSGAGTKLAAATLMGHVAIEVDGFEASTRTAWSVVAKGRAVLLERMEELLDAEDLPLRPWAQDEKPNIVRVRPTTLTGRRFVISEDVSPDRSIGWTEEERRLITDRLGVSPEPGAAHHPGEPFLHPD